MKITWLKMIKEPAEAEQLACLSARTGRLKLSWLNSQPRAGLLNIVALVQGLAV